MTTVTQKELRTSNKLLGYRSMWNILKTKYGVNVKRYGLKNAIVGQLILTQSPTSGILSLNYSNLWIPKE